MNHAVLDNWTFQTIGELYDGGYSSRTERALVVSSRSHVYETVSSGELQLQALIDLLTNIILRDKLKVDAAFVHAWQPFREIFEPIQDARLIGLTAPPKTGSAIANGTAFIVPQLCVTSSLKKIQTVNEKHYENHGESKYKFQSQIVWGAAGMLSRSHVFDAPYVGHPLRQRFLESTGVFQPVEDPVRQVVELVNTSRAAIYGVSTPSLAQRYAELKIPAVAVEVIMKSSSPWELIPNALEERRKHLKLRDWFTSFRNALSEGDTVKVSTHRKDLNLLVRDVDRLIGRSQGPGFSLGVSYAGPSASFPVWEWLRTLGRPFTIRHDLMKQIKTRGNAEASDKLRALFSGTYERR